MLNIHKILKYIKCGLKILALERITKIIKDESIEELKKEYLSEKIITITYEEDISEKEIDFEKLFKDISSVYNLFNCFASFSKFNFCN